MFDIGFGDCTLFTFTYRNGSLDDRNQRHLLVDCGTTRLPYGSFKMDRVVQEIAVITAGQLDGLIATHRHKDHISAFGSDSTAAVFDDLQPKLIIRPWPDHPDAEDAAVDLSGLELADQDREFVKLMRGTQNFAQQTHNHFASKQTSGMRGTLRDLSDIALPNKAAVSNLERWANQPYCRTEYVAADAVGGRTLNLSPEIPGARLTILGPPTLAIAPNLNRQRADDPDEYWLRNAKTFNDAIGTRTLGVDAIRTLSGPDGIGAAAWLVRKLDSQSLVHLLRIVRSFDEAINNTSIVALLSAANSNILISGDAQIENWQTTIDLTCNVNDNEEVPNPDLRDKLANVDLYKVGHHGSRNGTPRSLVDLWQTERRTRKKLTTLLSTKENVHGHPPTSEVPRGPLITALRATSQMYSTEQLRTDEGSWRAWHGTTRPSGSFKPFVEEFRYGR